MKNLSRENKVEQFHRAMGTDVNVEPTEALLLLREQLLMEECFEVVNELHKIRLSVVNKDKITTTQWADLLKELGDLQYVLSGTIVSLSPIYGSFSPTFNRIHHSNMSKLGEDGKPVLREDGKVLKGPSYKPPYLEDLIK
tara:strand:- start:386 stop:805 length:420 start_codon:yes stop_codon:yes gene_type:complete